MATIVNARDVLLQAASPRFLGVQVGSNIQVPIVNIPGLSTALDGTREVTLTGTSQVYQIPKTGAISPASITVSAVLRNLTGTPTLTLTNGTMSVTPALASGVFTFTPAQMTSDTITLHLSLTVGAETFTDDWTVVKVREGADGVTGFLTNESFTLAADTANNVSTYTGANGNFKVFQGTTDVTTACTFSVPTGGNPDSLTYSLTGSGSGAGTYSVSGGFGTGISQTTLTIRATFGSMTIDKIFSLAKSKAGAAGGAGGTGPAGARGSQTFYVAISGSSYSDAVASSTASVGGGPIYGDVVTQYDNASNFALSKFWDGISSWVTINAVVDGNLLVQGTVGAQKLIVNNGSGNNLWWDANFQQNASGTWYTGPWGQYPSSQVVADGVSGGFVARSGVGYGTSGGSVGPVSAITTYRVPVTIGKQYRFSVKVRKSSSSNLGIVYFRANTGTAATGGYSDTPIGVEGNSVGTTWGTYSVVWTATTPYVGAMILINYSDTAGTGYQEWQDLRIEEMMDSALVVVGGITADRIDTRNLTIKDGSGTVLFGSGTNLDWANLTAQPSGIYNNNITLSGGAINGIGTGAGTVVDNGSITLSGGAIYGIGTGAGTAVANGNISISSGAISGIGTGNGSTVDNGYIGINGSGQFYGGGAGTGTTVSNNQISVSLASNAYTINGIGSSGTINIGGLGYTGDLNATVGAPSGTYVAGDLAQDVLRPSLKISTSNISTYINAAAIGAAYIGVLTAGNLTVTAVSDTVNGGVTSGGRVEITTNRIDVYDASNVRRVRLGNL